MNAYLVDVGTLLDEHDKEFNRYSGAYDYKYGYFDECQFYSLNLGEAVKYVSDYVKKGVDNTYGIVSQTSLDEDALFLSPSNSIYDVQVENESYNPKLVVFNARKENGVFIENFMGIEGNKPLDVLLEGYHEKDRNQPVTASRNQQSEISLFHAIQEFRKENHTVGSVAEVMMELQEQLNETSDLNLNEDQLYRLSKSLLDGSFYSDEPLLLSERVTALSTVLSNGFHNHNFFPEASPEKALEFMLQCDSSDFIAIVDLTAVENQKFYAPSWANEGSLSQEHFSEQLDNISADIESFLERKQPLAERITSAAARSAASAAEQSKTVSKEVVPEM